MDTQGWTGITKSPEREDYYKLLDGERIAIMSILSENYAKYITKGAVSIERSLQAVELLQEYFKLAAESKELKGKRSEISSRVGMCEGDYDKCYNESRLAFEDYCDACKAKTPISKQIEANAHRRVAIMNSLRAKVKA